MTGIFKIKNLTGIFFLSNNVNVIKLKRLGTSGVLAKEGLSMHNFTQNERRGLGLNDVI